MPCEPAGSVSGSNPRSSGSVPAPGQAVEDFVSDCVRRQTAQALNLTAAKIHPARSFAEYGVDSIVGVELVRRVNEALGLDLPSTTLFDYPSVATLTAHLVAEHGHRLESRQSSQARPPQQPLSDLFAPTAPLATFAVLQTQPQPRATEIAVVGLAGRFPGAADTSHFWDNLKAGVCSITEVPRERWDVSAYYDPEPGKAGKSPCKWGAYLDGIDQFDPLFFQMSGVEAEFTDLQHRLFHRETKAWLALE